MATNSIKPRTTINHTAKPRDGSTNEGPVGRSREMIKNRFRAVIQRGSYLSVPALTNLDSACDTYCCLEMWCQQYQFRF